MKITMARHKSAEATVTTAGIARHDARRKSFGRLPMTNTPVVSFLPRASFHACGTLVSGGGRSLALIACQVKRTIVLQ